MFEGEGGNTDFDPQDVLQPNRDDDGRYIFKFEGCNDDSSIGKDAYGFFYLDSMIMMPAKMDSGPFGLKICKDEDCAQVISVLAKDREPFIPASQIILNDMNSDSVSISALIDRVQIKNLITIEFSIVTPIYKDARVVIEMPDRLVIPPGGGDVENYAGSTTA